MARSAALLAVLALTIGATPASRLEVEIDKLRSEKGLVRICLTRKPASFPKCVDDAEAITRNIPADQDETRFDGLAPGEYALAVLHDENANRKLDTFAGIPREGVGFSRNPPITFGPPRFKSAQFTLTGDAAEQQVRMRYFL